MKVLVTGGAGFIGSHIVDELVKRNYTVRVLDNFSTGKIENLKDVKDKIEIIKGDICNENDLKKAMKGMEYILHQAALRSVPRSVDDPVSTNNVNITGTLLLLKVASESKIKRVVYASSSSVYGDDPRLPKIETHLPAPVSPYAVSKLTGEYYCRVYTKLFNLETVSLRYFNVFGPRQDPESQYSAVIPKFIFSAMNDQPLEIHGDGLQSRDFSYVENIVEANILALEAKNISGEVFNIACNKNYTVIEIAEEIRKIMNKKIEKKFMPARPGDVRHTLADISKAEKLLNYKVKVDFEEGMKRTVEYFIKGKKI